MMSCPIIPTAECLDKAGPIRLNRFRRSPVEHLSLMKREKLKAGGNVLRLMLFFIAVVVAFTTLEVKAGTWTALSDTPSGGVQLMMLMTDGTVACYDGSYDPVSGGDWYRLVPNSSGSYANGTFVAMA